MIALLDNFSPDLVHIIGLAALLVVCAALVALGAAVAGAPRIAEADLICGWAIVSVIVVVLGTTTAVSFSHIAVAVLVAAIGAAVLVVRRDGRLANSDIVRTVVLAMPVIALVTAMLPSQWDEFSHWLPNAYYILEVDGFPGAGRPKSMSAWPAYPYGLPLVIYATSRIAGNFVDNAGGLFNLALMISFALLIARILRMAVSADQAGIFSQRPLGWAYCALGGLAVTALNPTFVPKIVFTAYADAGTSVATGFGAVLGWSMLEALAENDERRARRMALQLGFVFAALINLKQANMALVGILIMALLAAGTNQPGLRFRRLARLSPHLLLFPIVVYVAWQLYAGSNISGGALVVRPVSEWSVSLTPDIVARMLLIASKKGGYFAVMLVAVVFAARAMARPDGRFGQLAIITGFTFVLYNTFLLFTYVAAFGESEARAAVSYWRYNTHLGGICVAFGAYGIGLLWRRYLAPRIHFGLGWVPIVLLLAIPIAASGKLRFDNVAPKLYVRAVGSEMAGILPAGTRLSVLDPTDNGFYRLLLGHMLNGSAEIVFAISAGWKKGAREIAAELAGKKANYAWVHVPTPKLERALGTRLPKRSSYLLVREPAGWAIMRAWPYPGYDDPRNVGD